MKKTFIDCLRKSRHLPSIVCYLPSSYIHVPGTILHLEKSESFPSVQIARTKRGHVPRKGYGLGEAENAHTASSPAVPGKVMATSA